MCNIKINETEKALINGKTGELFRPSCFDILVPYHSYLKGRGQHDKADELLREVFRGEKVISNMIDQTQKHNVV